MTTPKRKGNKKWGGHRPPHFIGGIDIRFFYLLLDHFLYFDRTVAVCRADEVQARSKFALYGTADRVDDGRYDGLLYFGCVNRRAAALDFVEGIQLASQYLAGYIFNTFYNELVSTCCKRGGGIGTGSVIVLPSIV